MTPLTIPDVSLETIGRPPLWQGGASAPTKYCQIQGLQPLRQARTGLAMASNESAIPSPSPFGRLTAPSNAEGRGGRDLFFRLDVCAHQSERWRCRPSVGSSLENGVSEGRIPRSDGADSVAPPFSPAVAFSVAPSLARRFLAARRPSLSPAFVGAGLVPARSEAVNAPRFKRRAADFSAARFSSFAASRPLLFGVVGAGLVPARGEAVDIARFKRSACLAACWRAADFSAARFSSFPVSQSRIAFLACVVCK